MSLNLNLNKLRGVDLLPPLSISLFFTDQTLKKVSLAHSEEFALQFYGNTHQKDEIIAWFTAYFQGSPIPFPLELFSDQLGAFSNRVLEQLQNITFGKTMSYSAIAKNVGSENGARAVGNACRENPFPFIIPCHRVIKTDGTLGGFAYGTPMKKELLNFEMGIIEKARELQTLE